MAYDDDEFWITGEQINFDWYDELVPVPLEKKKREKDGCFCEKCKEFFPFAEPNQSNDTLICYSCRHPW